MHVISFAKPKGGAGKTTTALILATQLSENGATVSIIDRRPRTLGFAIGRSAWETFQYPGDP